MSCDGKRLKHLGSLGLNSDKDNENEIKRAYKKMALKYHPDKNPGDDNATRKFQEISEAYRFLAERPDDSDGEWQSDSDSSCSDFAYRFRFTNGSGKRGFCDADDDDLLLFYLLSKMFDRPSSFTTYSFSRGGDSGRQRQTRSQPTRPTERKKSPVFEAKPPPSYEESEKERVKREKRQAKKKRQKERRNNEKSAEKEGKENRDEPPSNENSRQGSPECPEDDDEAKLLYEYLADKHGFQAKDSTPDDHDADEDKRDKSKTFDEWKAERQQKKNKAQEQEEQRRRDEEAKSIGEELKRKAKLKEEKEKKQKAKQQKQKEEREKKEREEEEKRQKELQETEARRRKKLEEEMLMKTKQKQKQQNGKNDNDQKTKKQNEKVIVSPVDSDSDSESDSDSDESGIDSEDEKGQANSAPTVPAKREATAEAGFVTNSKAQKVPKPLSREYLNTQKKLPEFMLKETDPIKRMKYKTEICKIYQQTGVCPKRDYCVYAHGKHEMRVKPKCQMCFKWQAGYCPFMDDSAQCVFAHGEDEFRPELTEIYLSIHPDVAQRAAAAATVAAARASAPAPNPYVLEPDEAPQTASRTSATTQDTQPLGMVLGPRDADGGYMTIQPASEMEEMEMLRRAIEISMLEERSRKTEQLLLNKPVSQLKASRPPDSVSDNSTVILGVPSQNIPSSNPPRKETAVGGADSSLFPSFHNESLVTGLPMYPPTLSDLRQNSQPLRESPTRAHGNLAPIGTPPPAKPPQQPPQTMVGAFGGAGPPPAAGPPSAVAPAANPAKSMRLPPGLGTSNIVPLPTEQESKPKMNGFYDTAVIMPAFQNDPYNFDAEFQSDEDEEEFISDEEFDTPIFTGGSPTQSLLANPPAQLQQHDYQRQQIHPPPQPQPPQPQPAPTQPAPTQPAPTQPAPTQPAPTQPTAQNQQSQPLQQRQTQPEVKEPLPSQDGAALVDKTDEDVPTNKTKTEQKEVKKVAPVTKPVSKPAGHGAMINGRPVVYSNKLCKHGDSCWSVICPFRHPERENGGRGTAPNEKTKAVPPWKTKECWNWINKGNCPYKDSCYFAHGKKELAKTN